VEIMEIIKQKRIQYFADPSIEAPLEYTSDELKALKYVCETSEFYPLTHIGITKYMLSLDARLMTIESGYITQGGFNKEGRRIFTLSDCGNQRQVQANVLMAWAFLGPPPTPQHDTVDHMDIDETNDYYFNLRWATRQQQAMNRKKGLKYKRGRPVTQIDPITGVELFTWFRAIDAAIELGIKGKGSIANAIKENYSCGGYRWRYANNLIIDATGKVEEWRKINYMNCRDVWVSSVGRVKTSYCGFSFGRTTLSGRKLVSFQLNDGSIKGEFVHRLIIFAFKGPAPSEDQDTVDHIDGNPRNNRTENLRYLSVAENNRHAFVTGNRTANYHRGMCKAVVQLT